MAAKQNKPKGKGKRPRIIFDPRSGLLRQAIDRRAAKETVKRRHTVSATELLNDILEAVLREELEELEEE